MALLPPNSDSFRAALRTAPEERSALQVQINDMVLMTEGMTFILHHSSDLGDDDGMGMMRRRAKKKSLSQFHTWTVYLDLILSEHDSGVRKLQDT